MEPQEFAYATTYGNTDIRKDNATNVIESHRKRELVVRICCRAVCSGEFECDITCDKVRCDQITCMVANMEQHNREICMTTKRCDEGI